MSAAASNYCGSLRRNFPLQNSREGTKSATPSPTSLDLGWALPGAAAVCSHIDPLSTCKRLIKTS